MFYIQNVSTKKKNKKNKPPAGIPVRHLCRYKRPRVRSSRLAELMKFVVGHYRVFRAHRRQATDINGYKIRSKTSYETTSLMVTCTVIFVLFISRSVVMWLTVVVVRRLHQIFDRSQKQYSTHIFSII